MFGSGSRKARYLRRNPRNLRRSRYSPSPYFARSSTHYSKQTIEKEEVLLFLAQQIEGQSLKLLRTIFASKNRTRVALRLAKPKIEQFFPIYGFQYSAWKIERPSISDLRSRNRRNPPSSIFGTEDWVEDSHRPLGWFAQEPIVSLTPKTMEGNPPEQVSGSTICTTETICDSIFGSENRKWRGSFDFRNGRTKMGRDLRTQGVLRRCEKVRKTRLLRRTLHLRRTQRPPSKNPLSSIFGAEDRKIHPTSIFDLPPKIEGTPHLRSSAPKHGSKIERKKGGGCDLVENGVGGLRRWKGVLRSSRFEEQKLPHFPPARPEERRIPTSSTFSARGTTNPPRTSSSDYRNLKLRNPKSSFEVPDKLKWFHAVVGKQFAGAEAKQQSWGVWGQYRTFSCRPDSKALQRQGSGAFGPRARANQVA